ncbi:MAG: type II toxin-antitoxin system prevent-host-death family antitoxin [bacterium]
MPKRNRGAEKPAPATGPDHRPVIEVAAGVFKDTCLQLLDQVRDQSVEVIVTKRGEPVARVVPASGSLPSAFGFMRGTVTGRGDIVSPDPEAWGDLA